MCRFRFQFRTFAITPSSRSQIPSSPIKMTKNTRILALFDVDGTLTPARKGISADFIQLLKELRQKIVIGTVGGSDLVKQMEQLGDTVIQDFDYCFSENGLVGYHNGELLSKTNLKDQYTNEQLNRFINFCLQYIANLEIPIKRGTFIEFRSGMLNISPIGRNCSREERNEFEIYDHQHKIRENMITTLQKEFPEYNLTYSIGGQISFDAFPTGWDKTYCLNFLDAKDYDEIHFFGDKTHQGGNDYEIYTSERTIGHTVTSPEDTMAQLKKLFF